MISRLFRTLPPFKGKQRLARLFLGKYLTHARNVLVPGKYGCKYYLPNVIETIGFEILINGVYEPGTINLINKRLSRNKYLLDIGANIGAIAIPLKKLRGDVRIICLEAAPWIFQYLEKNIAQNRMGHSVAINKAIAAKANDLVDFFSPHDKFGKGSLAPVFTDTSVKVTTTTLDALTENMDADDVGLIKIDVEGFESQAFLGGPNLLSGKAAPDILFEFVDWAETAAGMIPGDAQAILLSYGYKIHPVMNGRPGQPIEGPVRKGSHLLFATKNL